MPSSPGPGRKSLPAASVLLAVLLAPAADLPVSRAQVRMLSGLTGPPAFPHREDPVEPPRVRYWPVNGHIATPAQNWVRGDHISIQVNTDVNGDNVVADAGNEPSIAVDPGNPTRMVIGWRQFDTITSNFRQSGVAYSHDGGQTWVSPSPNVLEPGEFSSDPVLAADADGRFYYYALQPNRGPGTWACYMYRSDDGGVTWPHEQYAFGGDKAWFAVDTTGSLGRGHVYVAWSPNASCCTGIFNRSTNGGQLFSSPVTIPEFPRFGTVTVDPTGDVFVAGAAGSSFWVVRSSNAKDASLVPSFDQVVEVELDGSVGFGYEGSPNPGGLLGQVWIASDHSSGATGGNLYVAASVDPPGLDPMDVHIIRSEDGGLTWSDPVRINDDAVGNGAFQWFGTMSVAPNGRIDVIWNDTRGDPSGTFSELYYSFSLDGGQTWSVNEPLSPAYNHFLGYPDQNKLGDYYDMISDNLGAHIAYAATFNGEQDVYYLRIGDIDCNDNGVPDIDDIAQKTSPDCNANSVPDECDFDCDLNGVVDDCEAAAGTIDDCNDNNRPDICDPDYDMDAVPDACDADIDGDGIPNGFDQCAFTLLELPVMLNGAPIGDSSGNCMVDLVDYVRLQPRCLSFGPGVFQTSSCYSFFDYDGDFDVDLRDVAGFQFAFGKN